MPSWRRMVATACAVPRYATAGALKPPVHAAGLAPSCSLHLTTSMGTYTRELNRSLAAPAAKCTAGK